MKLKRYKFNLPCLLESAAKAMWDTKCISKQNYFGLRIFAAI